MGGRGAPGVVRAAGTGSATAVAPAQPGDDPRCWRGSGGLATEVARSPHRPPRRRLPRAVRGWSRWVARRRCWPRLAMTRAGRRRGARLDLADSAAGGAFPSLVLLLAPVAPLLGVAAAWSRRLDPAYELVVASPGRAWTWCCGAPWRARGGDPGPGRRGLAGRRVAGPVAAALPGVHRRGAGAGRGRRAAPGRGRAGARVGRRRGRAEPGCSASRRRCWRRPPARLGGG